MNNVKYTKISRILTIYLKLSNKELVGKTELAKLFNVSEKSIQRDLEDIRFYFYNNTEAQGYKEIIYDYEKKGYYLESNEEEMTKKDVLAISKILLESRAFCKDELNHLLNVILKQVDQHQRKYIKDIIANEASNYVPLQHKGNLLSKVWDLSEVIRNYEVIAITYKRADGKEVQREIMPLAIIFSEYYFYLISYVDDLDSPTIFRVDRIKECRVTGRKFKIPYSKRFEDGEFRKRIQFMYTGKLITIKFEFNSRNIEAVLDRLPTAVILESKEDKYLVQAEVYGTGIIMWILSQGSKIKVLEPKEIVSELIDEVKKLSSCYKLE